MQFEIFRLNETDGRAKDSVIAEADAVRELIDRAAATGERLYIRPLATPAATATGLPGA